MPKPATPTSTTKHRTTRHARKRRKFAQMLHAELTGNPPWPAGHGIVTSIQDMPISQTPYGLAGLETTQLSLRRALTRAPADAGADPRQLLAAPSYRPRTVATTTPPRGAVRLHGEDYSLVFGYTIDPQPRPTAPVLVLLDDLPGLALRVDNDPDIRTRVLVVEEAVSQVLQVARVARPEAFTDPVTAGVDGHRLISRPR